ncbi:sporulation membrane protein YtaF [Heyndrickxia oleronia]|uniref:sporulation membrane protein YtaF n=1 Tax=Heyndrickxia oleronia TaxID=38875 RepID=UPI00203F3C82|nr:sporulation membrane protein YtaF [Heyndrickxia oleronia]
MSWLVIFAFAVSSSIDNLGVGISYGIRKIRIGVGANLFIAVICFLMSVTGISFGMWLSYILPGMFPVIVGSFLLIIIGIRIMLLAVPRKSAESKMSQEQGEKGNGLDRIMKNSEAVDREQNLSGGISWWEAGILGVALSANALTNGLGAGLLGLSPFAISLTAAIGSFISIWIGTKLGTKLADIRIGKFTIGQFGTLLSGAIILVIAINAFF